MNTKKSSTDILILRTKRLILRRIILDDAEELFEFCKDPDLFRYIGGRAHKTKAESENFIRDIENKYTKREILPWGLVYKENNKLIGDCAFLLWSEQPHRAELDYLLSKSYWNQGLMTEAVKELIRFGFEKLRLERIQAMSEIANAASIRVMEKSGMTFEGVLRNYITHEGKSLDMKMYSIIREQWRG
jgi:ribosomal-protein-alanine N-acetyltransferase